MLDHADLHSTRPKFVGGKGVHERVRFRQPGLLSPRFGWRATASRVQGRATVHAMALTAVNNAVGEVEEKEGRACMHAAGVGRHEAAQAGDSLGFCRAAGCMNISAGRCD